jgi:hypothetical protein
MANSAIGPLPIISDTYNFLNVCLQELILELTRWNMVEQYMIKMKDITIYTTKEDYYWGALTIILVSLSHSPSWG